MFDNTDVRGPVGIAREDLAFHVRFYTDAVEVKRGEWENHDFIELTWDNGDSQHPIDLDRKETTLDGQVVLSAKAVEFRRRFEPYYLQWKKTQVNTPVGYSLERFFANEPAKAKLYAAREIYTVEQLSAQPEGNIQGCGPDAYKDQKRAKEFVDSMKSASAMEPLVVKMNAMEAELSAKQQENIALNARLEALEAKMGESKPKLGRPRKEED